MRAHFTLVNQPIARSIIPPRYTPINKKSETTYGAKKAGNEIPGILPPRPGNCPATTLPPRHHTTIYSPQIQRNVLPVVTETFVVPNSRVPAHVVDVRGSRSPRGSRTYSTEEPRRVSYFIYFMYPRKRSLLRVEIIKAGVWLSEIVVVHTEALRLGRNVSFSPYIYSRPVSVYWPSRVLDSVFASAIIEIIFFVSLFRRHEAPLAFHHHNCC
jgi:hypothetical protein